MKCPRNDPATQLGELDNGLITGRETAKRPHNILTTQLGEPENGLMTDKEATKRPQVDVMSLLGEMDGTPVAVEGTVCCPQDDASSPLGEPSKGVAADGETSRHARKEMVFSSPTREEWRSGMCSQEGLLQLQISLNPPKTSREAQFAPPYPQFPTPFRACFFHQWSSKILPPRRWPHPLFFCRPPHNYPLYYL